MRKIFYAVLAVAGFFAISCNRHDPSQPALPEIRIKLENPRLDIGYDGKTTDVTIVVNRDFQIVNDVDWIAVDEPSVSIVPGESKEVSISVTALPNDIGNDRLATIRFQTISTHVEIVVAQAANPDAAPNLVFGTNFGKNLKNLDKPLVNESDCWMGFEEGASKNVEYYMPANSKVSVRNSSTSGSSGYTGASGKNFLWFGSAGEFAVGKIAIHPLLKSLTISFGLQRAVYGVKENHIIPNEFPVWVSKDGALWKKLEYKVINPQADQWSLCESTIAIGDSPVEQLYLRFCPTKASAHRLDDLKVSNGGNGGTAIDWTTGTDSFTLGPVITFETGGK